jgi:hypothetical protein
MPWAGLGKQTIVGRFTMIPWPKCTLPNQALHAFLDRLFSRYIDHYGQPVRTITVVLRGNTFTPLSSGVHESARRAADALLFSVIAPGVQAAVTSNNPSLVPPTADAYQLVSQCFQLGDDTIAVRVGGSVHAANVDRLTIPKPWDVGGSCGFPDEKLLAALGELLHTRKLAAVRERLFSSLEWFRLAHTVGDGSSSFTRAVMLATAFEVLFSLPRHQKTKQFIAEVERRLVRPGTRKKTALDYTRHQHSYSLPGWWAHDFYDLRSRIVHGDPLKLSMLRYRNWVTHLIVADLVFWQCVATELYSLKLLGNTIRKLSKDYDRLCPNQPAGWHEQDLIDMFLHFKEVHRALGWLPKARKK